MPRYFNLLPLLAGLMTFLALSSCTPSSSDPHAWRKNLRQSGKPSLLFIGNSYTNGMPTVLRDIAKRHGITIHVTEVTHGGWTLHQHAHSSNTLKTIRRGGWDIVVLQEQSRRLSLPETQRAKLSYPAIRKLADEARAAGATPVLYRTWGRRDGDPELIKKGQPDTFFTMHERLTQGYQNAAETAGNIPILPVGDAWAREVRAGHSDLLFEDDGSHPTQKGIQLNAHTIFSICFPEHASKPSVAKR